ncbi:response regulator [candidate division KSB1 bacterium]|nr:response regulator [candidate division KSB1 bacterium]
MDQLKALIVDDMRLIRTELRHLLSEYPDIKVVGEAANVDNAFQLVSKLKPDVVFLDIYLPGQSGFDFLDNLDVEFKVIFISSFYDKYSEEAQKYKPVDFLMKPINKQKLSKAIQKLHEIYRLNQESTNNI